MEPTGLNDAGAFMAWDTRIWGREIYANTIYPNQRSCIQLRANQTYRLVESQYPYDKSCENHSSYIEGHA